MMRLWTVLTASLALTLAGSGVAAPPPYGGSSRVSWWASARAVPVAAYADGARLDTDALMLKGLGRTMLPMRALFTALGAQVEWNPLTQSVSAWKADGTGARFVVGARRMEELVLSASPDRDPQATVAEVRKLDAPAMLIGGRVYVPVRAAADALRAQVRWVGTEPAIYLEAESGTAPSGVESSQQEPLTAVDLVLTLPKTRFRMGESVPMELTLANAGEVPVTFTFPTAQQFEFQVLQGERIAWTWSGERAFPQVFTTHTLEPGEKTSFSTRWDQVSNLGRAVSPGTYTLRGWVTATPRQKTLRVERQIEIVL